MRAVRSIGELSGHERRASTTMDVDKLFKVGVPVLTAASFSAFVGIEQAKVDGAHRKAPHIGG